MDGRMLSQDLRDRAVAAIDGGLSCRAAAARFGISTSSAIRWRPLALEHGQAVAKPRGGDRHSGRIEAVGAALCIRPPYSPDFNPIEKAFSRLKAMLRKAGGRTVHGLWDPIG